MGKPWPEYGPKQHKREREGGRQTKREMSMHKEAAYKRIIYNTKITYLKVSGKNLYELKC